MVRRLVEHDHVELARPGLARAPPAWPALRTARLCGDRTAAARRATSRPRRPPTSRRGTRRRCRRAAAGSWSSAAIRTPRPNRTSPSSGIWAPARIRIRVDFPEPFTPTMATRSPVEIVTDSSSNSTLSGWAMPTLATSTQITRPRYGALDRVGRSNGLPPPDHPAGRRQTRSSDQPISESPPRGRGCATRLPCSWSRAADR